MSNLNNRTIKVLGNDKIESFKNKVILGWKKKNL